VSQRFPPLRQLVPHSGPMCLLDRVLEHEGPFTACAAHGAAAALLADADAGLPVWVGIEYMAQCVAVHGGLVARERGLPPRAGILLGSRRIEFGTDRLPSDVELRVVARHRRGERGLASFDCEVESPAGGPALVRGRLNVYIVDSLSELWRGAYDDS
jgi:predicted hotdog family 3-hydroxylacyl-ACP dehydratase